MAEAQADFQTSMLTREREVKDAQLVSRIAAGDERALGALYDTYGASVYGLALVITQNPLIAESVVADAFAAVWLDARAFDAAHRSVFGWLASMVRALALAERRAATVSLEPVPLSPADASPIGAALARLTPSQRTAIELAYFRGMSRADIASSLGEPDSAVGTYLRTAMETLRHVLQPETAAPVTSMSPSRMVAGI